MYFTELEIGNEVYKLRLNTRGIVALEKALGYNPLEMLLKIDAGEMPKLTDVIIVLHSMLQALQHGITIDKTYDIFDEYSASGKTMFDLIPVFIEVFQNCGFLQTNSAEEETEKN